MNDTSSSAADDTGSMSFINDDVFELRFSDLPEDMDEVISDIINEQDLEENQNQNQYPNQNQSSTSVLVSDDGSTRKNNTAATAAMTVSNDEQGRPSILSMRTSLLSPAMADRFLEGFMMKDATSTITAGSGSGSGFPLHRPTRSGPRTARTAQARTATTRTITAPSQTVAVGVGVEVEAGGQPPLPISSTPPFNTDPLPMQTPHFNTDPLPMQTPSMYANYATATNGTRSSSSSGRFSMITTDPELFGGFQGGIPIDINDISCSSMKFSMQQDPSLSRRRSLVGSQSQSQPPQSRRFSVSRKAVALFDQPFDDDDDDEAAAAATATAKPVAVVSSTFAETYGKETATIQQVQEAALEQEMNLLSMNDKATINFDVHGIKQQQQQQQMIPQSQMLDQESFFGSGTVHGSSGSSSSNNNTRNQSDNTVDSYLQQLEEELRTHCNNNNNETNADTTDTVTATAFLEAQQMNPSYVNSKEFRVIFLRRYLDTTTHTYDVPKAAQKIFLHFQTKKLIFGNDDDTDILGRDVRLSDLSIEDRRSLDSGAIQIMPHRDTAGRAIMLYAPQQRIFDTIDNWLKAQWYLMWQCAKSVENSRDNIGIIVIVYFRGWLETDTETGIKRDTFEQAQQCTLVREAIPNRLVALHYCYQDASMQALMTAQKVHFLTRNLRSRFREHFSHNHQEICFQLETYGIPIDKQILLPNGHLGMKWYNEWIQIRVAQEAETEAAEALHSSGGGNGSGNETKSTPRSSSLSDDTIMTPRNFDVLFGRGRDTREHCGNLRCAHLVEMHQQEYEQCTKTEKTQLATRIVSMVQDCQGRFLKKDRTKGWQPVSDGKAREKVSHFFRHLRAMTATTTTTTTTTSSSSSSHQESSSSQKKESTDTDTTTTTHASNEKRSQHPTTEEEDQDRDNIAKKHITHVVPV